MIHEMVEECRDDYIPLIAFGSLPAFAGGRWKVTKYISCSLIDGSTGPAKFKERILVAWKTFLFFRCC